MSDQPVRIFVSYSHFDTEYLAEDSLLGFLRGLEQDGAEFWTDERITAGDKWDDDIRSRIAQTDIALVLVSQTFLDSQYCASVEIASFLERSCEAGLVIFPIILSPCEWERHAWLRSTQHLPGQGETIEEDFLDVGVRKRLFLTIRSNLREQIEKRRRAREESPRPATSAKRPIAGERRQVTALECELTSVAGAGSLDPEEVVQILPEYRSRAADIVTRLDGHVGQQVGRRLLAYFGCPRSHEDDARRAVLAACEMMELAKDLNRSAGTEHGPLAFKLVIHTGSMVVSAASESAEPVLVGDLPDVLSAMANLAEPDRVHLSSATHGLIQQEFVCAEAGAVELKERGQLLRLYTLARNGPSSKPAATVEAPPRHTLVARDQELETLRQRWELAKEATGQVVLIRGEAGIGKSRLVREFRNEVTSPEMAWLECRCSPYYQNTEFYPIIDLLHRALALVEPERQITDGERLEILVRRMDMPVETIVPLLGALLSVPLAPVYQPSNLSPEGRKKKTVAAVLDLILKLAERQPVLMIVEDLHWIDASSRGFFDLLLEMQGTARVLSLLTFRPEFDPTWRQLSYLSEISLRRLGSKEVRMLISGLTDKGLLPTGLVEEIVVKADGIPLFAEELTKMVAESEWIPAEAGGYHRLGESQELAVPATLEGSLMARLDRLGTAKEIAQVASVIGREFSQDLLAQCVTADEESLAGDLERLLQSEIILRRGLASEALYLFKHVLIQQAAYQSILHRDARQLHGRLARALEDHDPQLVERQPELVAFHFTRAGCKEKAIDYWQRAAERSIKNSANPEAVGHLTNCLELLAELPESRERDRREMSIRIALALPLIATRGYGAEEVNEELSRARTLCTEVGEDMELFRVLRLLWTFQTVRGNHRVACDAARQLVRMADSQDATHLKLEASRVMGASLFYSGHLAEALHDLAASMALYNRQRDHSHVLIYGQDPGVGCLSNESLTLWFMGYPERALAKGSEAVSLARELAHPYSLCYSLFFCSWQHIFLRDVEKVRGFAEEMILVSRHQTFPFWETMGIILRGWVRVQQGETGKGLATMREGIASWRKLGARLYLPSFLSLVADIHAGEGDGEAGLAAVEEGLDVVRETGEGFCEPELWRLKGELLGMRAEGSSPGRREAEAHLLSAREIAARQASRFLELRAAISLSRFWLAEGKREAARQVLEESRQWFGEDSATCDLKRADELLAELGQ